MYFPLHLFEFKFRSPRTTSPLRHERTVPLSSMRVRQTRALCVSFFLELFSCCCLRLPLIMIKMGPRQVLSPPFSKCSEELSAFKRMTSIISRRRLTLIVHRMRLVDHHLQNIGLGARKQASRKRPGSVALLNHAAANALSRWMRLRVRHISTDRWRPTDSIWR